jgi:hypothetical protein
VKTVIFSGMITNKILVVIPDLVRTHPGRIGEHHPRPHWFFSWNRSLTVCYCGPFPQTTPLANSACSTHCPGSPTQFCGGPNGIINVFTNG